MTNMRTVANEFGEIAIKGKTARKEQPNKPIPPKKPKLSLGFLKKKPSSSGTKPSSGIPAGGQPVPRREPAELMSRRASSRRGSSSGMRPSNSGPSTRPPTRSLSKGSSRSNDSYATACSTFSSGLSFPDHHVSIGPDPQRKGLVSSFRR